MKEIWKPLPEQEVTFGNMQNNKLSEHNVIALYETIAKIFSIRENCNISVKVVKQKEK